MKRYIESRRPETVYLTPTENVITDPLVVTAASLGVFVVDRYVTGGSQVGDVSLVTAIVSGTASIVGGWARFASRQLNVVMNNPDYVKANYPDVEVRHEQ